jgi:hypothetical protein
MWAKDIRKSRSHTQLIPITIWSILESRIKILRCSNISQSDQLFLSLMGKQGLARSLTVANGRYANWIELMHVLFVCGPTGAKIRLCLPLVWRPSAFARKKLTKKEQHEAKSVSARESFIGLPCFVSFTLSVWYRAGERRDICLGAAWSPLLRAYVI